jgi:aerobic-type carbon monoxide dehydrogenase small subunit (CoxS/CutS family)
MRPRDGNGAVRVNGMTVEPGDPARRLLDFLRDELDLTGAKEGCGMGECGACTVLVDGEPVCSCLVLVGQVAGADVVTAEGLAQQGLHPVQRAFVDAHASQCGFCTPGMIVAAAALLARDPDPADEAIRLALAGNLCRCTGYTSIFDALRRARSG